MSIFWQARGVPSARWKDKLFTASTTFVVPNDVCFLYADCCGGGSGGGGGDATPGGGGGGGGPAMGLSQIHISVVPGETITLTVGAAGTGGAIGENGTGGGDTILSVPSGFYYFCAGAATAYAGAKGNGTTGGDGGTVLNKAKGSGGAINVAGGNGVAQDPILIGLYGSPLRNPDQRIVTGAGGGGLNANGGTAATVAYSARSVAGGTGSAAGGGGGGGGCCGLFGLGGRGGHGGAAGNPATGYGAGGGGGGGNAIGGNGSPGFVRFYLFTAYAI